MTHDYVAGDWALAFLSTLAWASMVWSIAHVRSRVSWARWLIVIGWIMFSMRLWTELFLYGDAPIHPFALIALSCIAFGTVCLHMTRLLSLFRGRRNEVAD